MEWCAAKIACGHFGSVQYYILGRQIRLEKKERVERGRKYESDVAVV